MTRIPAFEIGRLMMIPPGHELRITEADRLQVMYDMQREFQRMVPPSNLDPTERPPAEQMDYIRVQALALIKEIGEALDESGWKPWTTSNHLHKDAFKSEIVDAWHFLMNLMFVCDMSTEDLFQGYLHKQAVNRARVRDGYDGVSTKCPKCKRAYDDEHVKCKPPTESDHAWCQQTNSIVEDDEFVA